MRRQIVEIECSRCKRVERRPLVKAPGTLVAGVDWASGPDTTTLTVLLAVDGKTEVQFSFTELCGPCLKTVQNHLEAIGKNIKGLSPDRASTIPAPTPVLPLVPDVRPSSVTELGAKKKAQGHP